MSRMTICQSEQCVYETVYETVYDIWNVTNPDNTQIHIQRASDGAGVAVRDRAQGY